VQLAIANEDPALVVLGVNPAEQALISGLAEELEMPLLCVADAASLPDRVSLVVSVHDPAEQAPELPPTVPVLWIVPEGVLPPNSLLDRCAACDFVRRPFQADELVLRARAVLGRARQASNIWRSTLRAGPLLVNRSSGIVQVNETACILRRAEYAILEYLLDHSERFVTSEELNREVLHGSGNSSAARNQIYELRRHLGLAGAPDAVEHVRGRGYRLRWPLES
jgi:DNA-binding winged helix-turn-helix (wHTH) protein